VVVAGNPLHQVSEEALIAHGQRVPVDVAKLFPVQERAEHDAEHHIRPAGERRLYATDDPLAGLAVRKVEGQHTVILRNPRTPPRAVNGFGGRIPGGPVVTGTFAGDGLWFLYFENVIPLGR